MRSSHSLRLVKGSHIVVPRCFEHDHAYIFQNPDKRIIFAIPYERDFTLIGTTDQEIHGDPRGAAIAADEVAYLCEQASRYFARPVTPADVVWAYAGVRPLLDDASGDPSAVTRDYLLERNTDAAPLLSVWGGKITTFRKLAEEAADQLVAALGLRQRPWTEAAFLPGGEVEPHPGEGQVAAPAAAPGVRAQSATRTPSAASAWATARPIPRDAAVTSAVLPLSPRSIAVLSVQPEPDPLLKP